MEGNIYINGEIGDNVHLVDIVKQVQNQPFATSFNVYINSVGGIVDVGFDIYNYLKSLSVPITTIGNGVVASIATVIFMAGSQRKLRKNTEFMIHLPSGSVSGTSSEIEDYNDMLKKYEKKLIDFYVEATGLQKEAIEPFLKNETWLTPENAFDFKFTTEAEQDFAIVAKAVFNLNTDNKMTSEDKNWIEKQFDSILAKFGKNSIKNIMLQDASGVSIEFPDVAEGEQVAVGAMALIDGAPAEGSFLMPEGMTYVFVGGSLTEINEPMEDMEALKAENEQLKTQLSEQVQAVADKEAEIVAMAKEVKSFKAQIVSKLSIDDKKDPKKKEEGQPTKRKLLKD